MHSRGIHRKLCSVLQKSLLLSYLAICWCSAGDLAKAAQIYQLRTDAGIPVALRGSALKNPLNGYTGLTNSAGQISITSDGKLFAYDSDAGAYGQILLDPSKAARTDLASAPSNNAGLLGFSSWSTTTTTSTYYSASANGAPGVGTRINLGSGLGEGGISRATPNNTFFAWANGGSITLNELQFQDTSGNFSTTAGYAARLGSTASVTSSGQFKRSIDWISQTSDVYQMIGGRHSSSGAISRLFKFQLGALTGYNPGTLTEGTRTISNGTDTGLITKDGLSGTATALLDDLVPGIGDSVRAFRYHEPTNRLFLVSDDATNVYLSAITFNWGAFNSHSSSTYVDLDPDSANNYLSFTYNSGTAATSLTSARGLAIDDATGTIYIMGAGQRIFIVDPVAVPEPSTLAMLGVGCLGLLAIARRRISAQSRRCE